MNSKPSTNCSVQESMVQWSVTEGLRLYILCYWTPQENPLTPSLASKLSHNQNLTAPHYLIILTKCWHDWESCLSWYTPQVGFFSPTQQATITWIWGWGFTIVITRVYTLGDKQRLKVGTVGSGRNCHLGGYQMFSSLGGYVSSPRFIGGGKGGLIRRTKLLGY